MLELVRCISCGKQLGSKWEWYKLAMTCHDDFLTRLRLQNPPWAKNFLEAWLFQDSENPAHFEEVLLTALGCKRFCCRIALSTHVPRIDTLIALNSLLGKNCET